MGRDEQLSGSRKDKLRPGSAVRLIEAPPSLLRGLPKTDQEAIREIVGHHVLLVKHDEDGRAELKFTDRRGAIHFIYVDPSFISAVKKT